MQQLRNITNNVIKISTSGEFIAFFEGKGNDKLIKNLKFEISRPNIDHQIHLKAVLRDKAIFDLEAMLHVKKGAKNTNTYLKIDCLILSDKASARVIPGLEIMEDEVKSGHGATVSYIDFDQLDYLMSRGIPKKEAEELIVEGFLS